ncbi:unnamed protein product [Sphenostylis stenocarpa]|uniref:C2H2-type domain-containing protein n=1 Tax=Sphenostylis stenocarpa TaxID=92480 RepID=A0AA86W4C4_9FABA|nr:unnamed protein product [Sphenostylis stenocarpa]
MAMNSSKSNNFSTLFPRSGSNPTVPKNEALAVKGTSQLGLSQKVKNLTKTSLTTNRRPLMFHDRVNAAEKEKGKGVMRAQFSGLSPTSLSDGGDTESILRASQIVRAKLEHAVCNAVADTHTEENKKAMEMLQAKILSATAFASKSDAVVGGSTSSTQLAIIATPQRGSFLNHFAYPIPTIGGDNSRNSHFSLSQPDTEVDESITLCASPLSVCFPHESSYGRQKMRNSNVGEAAAENVFGNEDESEYDGRMHSNPYKKNGPYTCPKCGCMFETSQRFAAHVSSRHYRYETKSEKKKRMMAKIRRRNVRLEWENGALTIVADDAPRSSNSAFGFAGTNTNLAPPHAAPVKLKNEGETGVGLQLAPPPGWGRPEAGGLKVKLEPLDN